MTDCLVVIDVQRGFGKRPEARSNPGAEANIARLLQAFRTAGRPIIHIRHASVEPHSPLRAGHTPSTAAAELPGEPVLTKSVNGAFAGTDLQQRLREAGLTQPVTVGVQTDHCVSTTVLSPSRCEPGRPARRGAGARSPASRSR